MHLRVITPPLKRQKLLNASSSRAPSSPSPSPRNHPRSCLALSFFFFPLYKFKSNFLSSLINFVLCKLINLSLQRRTVKSAKKNKEKEEGIVSIRISVIFILFFALPWLLLSDSLRPFQRHQLLFHPFSAPSTELHFHSLD